MIRDEAMAIACAAGDAEIARSQMRRTEQYLARGRAYRDTPGGDLGALWVAGMREYARVIHPRPQVVEDAGAEFALRGIDPPWPAVRAETERLCAAAYAAFRGMSDDDLHAFGTDMIDAYLDERELAQ